jgi:6-pyruvoyltetrahydropterin/6-carboxytetrahydropterin synthase
MNEKFSIRIAGLSFSAAHFITYGRTRCEPLHGHSFRVEVEWSGPLSKHGYVLDFRRLRSALQEILGGLNDKVLLPLKNPAVLLEVDRSLVRVQCGKSSWELPRTGCALLEVENVTAEHLAAYLARRLLEVTTAHAWSPPESIKVWVEEEPGCWAACELTNVPDSP